MKSVSHERSGLAEGARVIPGLPFDGRLKVVSELFITTSGKTLELARSEVESLNTIFRVIDDVINRCREAQAKCEVHHKRWCCL